LSFAGNLSKVSVTTYREEGYDIQFRFRTTLESGQLVEGQGSALFNLYKSSDFQFVHVDRNPSLFFLELVSGRLNLHTSLLNRIEGVFIGSQLNDGKWKHVFLSINASHVVLSALDEQSIYPINSEYIGENSTTTVFPTTR
jgi:protein crumbs